MVELTPTSRSRGAQPGNHNALKHGFYSAAYKDLLLDPSQFPQGLQEEIILMRSIIRRVVESTSSTKSPQALLALLSSLGHAGVRLGSMLRVQSLLEHYATPETESALSAALARVWLEIDQGLADEYK